MVRVLASEKATAAAGWFSVLALALLACAVGLRAQGAQAGTAQAPQAPGPVAALPDGPAPATAQPAVESLPRTGNREAKGGGEDAGWAAGRAAGLTFSLWDRSPLDAFERAAQQEGGRSARAVDTPDRFESLNPGSSGMGGGGMGRGQMRGGISGRRGAVPVELNLGQLAWANPGMNVNSAAGKFSLAYQDALSARIYGPGSGQGMGSERATFTSTVFNDSLFDFSSSFVLGSGSSVISTHNGLSAGVMHGGGVGASQFGPGNGAGGKKPGSSLSVKLSF